MAYKPYKMKGHTLPGIKQRKADKMEDGRPGSSAFQYKESPAKKTRLTNAQRRKNLLKAVPNEEAFNKLSKVDQEGFTKVAKEVGLPMMPVKKSPSKWVQFIPAALSAISSIAGKKKEE